MRGGPDCRFCGGPGEWDADLDDYICAACRADELADARLLTEYPDDE
jgi:hypothetical protein